MHQQLRIFIPSPLVGEHPFARRAFRGWGMQRVMAPTAKRQSRRFAGWRSGKSSSQSCVLCVKEMNPSACRQWRTLSQKVRKTSSSCRTTSDWRSNQSNSVTSSPASRCRNDTSTLSFIADDKNSYPIDLLLGDLTLTVSMCQQKILSSFTPVAGAPCTRNKRWTVTVPPLVMSARAGYLDYLETRL